MADMDIKSFFAENVIKPQEREYVASQRFKDKDGNPIPWKLKVIPNKEFEELLSSCRKKEFIPKTRQYELHTDSDKLNAELVCASVVFPNLNDESLQKSYGTIGAEMTVKAMLTPGEYTDLVNAVTEACGFQAGMSDKIKIAKN